MELCFPGASLNNFLFSSVPVKCDLCMSGYLCTMYTLQFKNKPICQKKKHLMCHPMFLQGSNIGLWLSFFNTSRKRRKNAIILSFFFFQRRIVCQSGWRTHSWQIHHWEVGDQLVAIQKWNFIKWCFFRIVEWGGDWTTHGTNSLRPSACCSKMVDTSRYKYNCNLWALNLSFEF